MFFAHFANYDVQKCNVLVWFVVMIDLNADIEQDCRQYKISKCD